ncbi:VOC family protein [Nostoc sp. NIES-2111]
MSLKAVHHVLVTYPPEAGNATLNFYSQVLGLEEISRPDVARNVAGAWYALGQIQIHLGEEPNPDNQTSRRHICFLVDNLNAFEEHLKAHGVEIFADHAPVPDLKRFFLRDPAGNRLEITEFVGSHSENAELNRMSEPSLVSSTRL